MKTYYRVVSYPRGLRHGYPDFRVCSSKSEAEDAQRRAQSTQSEVRIEEFRD
jgi:hypothetical protein